MIIVPPEIQIEFSNAVPTPSPMSVDAVVLPNRLLKLLNVNPPPPVRLSPPYFSNAVRISQKNGTRNSSPTIRATRFHCHRAGFFSAGTLCRGSSRRALIAWAMSGPPHGAHVEDGQDHADQQQDDRDRRSVGDLVVDESLLVHVRRQDLAGGGRAAAGQREGQREVVQG